MVTVREVLEKLALDWNDEASEEWELLEFTSEARLHSYTAESYVLNRTAAYRLELRVELRQAIGNAAQALAILENSGD